MSSSGIGPASLRDATRRAADHGGRSDSNYYFKKKRKFKFLISCCQATTDQVVVDFRARRWTSIDAAPARRERGGATPFMFGSVLVPGRRHGLGPSPGDAGRRPGQSAATAAAPERLPQRTCRTELCQPRSVVERGAVCRRGGSLGSGRGVLLVVAGVAASPSVPAIRRLIQTSFLQSILDPKVWRAVWLTLATKSAGNTSLCVFFPLASQ